MIVLGVILAVIGFLIGAALLIDLGILLAVAGMILAVLGMAGHPVRGRRHYW